MRVRRSCKRSVMRGGRPVTSEASARMTSPTLRPSSINNRIRTADRRLMRSAAASNASASASLRSSAVLADSTVGRSISVSYGERGLGTRLQPRTHRTS